MRRAVLSFFALTHRGVSREGISSLRPVDLQRWGADGSDSCRRNHYHPAQQLAVELDHSVERAGSNEPAYSLSEDMHRPSSDAAVPPLRQCITFKNKNFYMLYIVIYNQFPFPPRIVKKSFGAQQGAAPLLQSPMGVFSEKSPGNVV